MKKTIYVTKSAIPDFDEYVSEIKEIWDTNYLTNMGPKHRQFNELLKDRFGVNYLDLYTNGHTALEIAIMALELKGEVITTPYTFGSTTHAIVRNALTPVFCDIKESDFTIDESKIEKLITDKTCAIMPVHVYGNICNIEEIQRIADKHNLKVIYDAAHAFDETYKGKSVASFGDASCFSFHATKVFNSIEGGAAAYKNEEVSVKAKRIKNFGIKGYDEVSEIGTNGKMNEFCAAMGICNLRHIDEYIKKRKLVTEKYIELLSGVKGLRLNTFNPDVQYNYSYFPIIVNEKEFYCNRDELKERLEKEGILARKYFYPLTSDFECYKNILAHGETPTADYISERVLTLPLYPDLSVEDVERICRLIINN